MASTDPGSIPPSSGSVKELAALVQHNLTHHHLWTQLRLEEVNLPDNKTYTLCTGVPPEQLHPDDVIEDSTKLPREWVLPVNTQQQWSIREWAEVFKGIDERVKAMQSDQPKVNRVVMACATNDGTIVYYFVNRGITKPRKN